MHPSLRQLFPISVPLCLALLLSGANCSPTPAATDAGSLDAGTVDSGVTDAGLFDAGPLDAGPLDAGPFDAGPPDAGSLDAGLIMDAGPVECSGGSPTFPTFSRTCARDSDCTIGLHQTNCCGSQQALGIAAAEGATFAADESICDSQYPACDCASGGVTTDDADGGTAPGGEASIVVHCVSNTCETSIRPTTACYGSTCTATQVCVGWCSGIPVDGGTPMGSCIDVPAACAASSQCSCFGAEDPCFTGVCQSVQAGVPLCLCE